DADAAMAMLLRASRSAPKVNGSQAAGLWEKLARQAPVAAATTASQRPIGELRSDPELRSRLEQAIEETCAVATADGVPLAFDTQWAIIESMPPKPTSSTARAVAAGRPSAPEAIT